MMVLARCRPSVGVHQRKLQLSAPGSMPHTVHTIHAHNTHCIAKRCGTAHHEASCRKCVTGMHYISPCTHAHPCHTMHTVKAQVRHYCRQWKPTGTELHPWGCSRSRKLLQMGATVQFCQKQLPHRLRSTAMVGQMAQRTQANGR